MSIGSSKKWQFDSAPAPEAPGLEWDWGKEPLHAAAGLAPRQAGKARDVADMASPLPWGYDEASFVTELQTGSEAAFDLLVSHYHGPVYSLLFGMLGDSADASDVSQEVFLKAFRGIRSFRGSSSLKTWLYRIAVREALNHRRWSWRHLRQQFSIDAEGPGGEGEAHGQAMQLEDSGPSPFEAMATREVQKVVHRALSKVPTVFRSAVILRDLEGLSYEEVAEVLEVSVGTVKSRILRGRAALKEILMPLWVATHSETGHAERPAAETLGALQALAGFHPGTIHGGGK